MTLSSEAQLTIGMIETSKQREEQKIQESYSRLLKLAEAGERENYEEYIQKEIDTLQGELMKLASHNQSLLDQRYGEFEVVEIN